MFIIAVLVVLALLVVGGIAVAVLSRNSEGTALGGGTALGAGVLLVIVFLASSFTTISANEIGIQTTFGKANGVIQPGPHLLAPWSDVERFSTRVQVLDMSNKDGSESPTVAVKFQGNSGGNVSTTTRWRIENDQQAIELWKNYRTFEAVQNQLVSSVLRDQLNETFASYAPTAAVDGKNRDQINKQIIDGLNAEDGLLKRNGIVVDSVSLQGIDPDQATQDRINRAVQIQADIENAKSEQEKARIDNQTNAERQQSLSPQALTNTCLDITRLAVEQGKPLPPTWNCLGGESNVVPTLQVNP